MTGNAQQTRLRKSATDARNRAVLEITKHKRSIEELRDSVKQLDKILERIERL